MNIIIHFAKSKGHAPDPFIYLFILNIAASVANAPAVNPSGIKTLLAYGFSTFFIKGKPVFSNDSKNLPKLVTNLF